MGMNNIDILNAKLISLNAALGLECMCECECCGNGPIDWALVRKLEKEIEEVEKSIVLELAAEAEALRFEALELAS